MHLFPLERLYHSLITLPCATALVCDSHHLCREHGQQENEPVSDEAHCVRRQIHHPIINNDVSRWQYHSDRYFSCHDSQVVGTESIQSGGSLAHEDSSVIVY